MTKVMKGRVRGVEGRNWELERRSQGTRRVQGEAVVQRLPKPLRGFALEEQAYIPKPWKEVGRKGSPLQTVCRPSPCFQADRSPGCFCWAAASSHQIGRQRRLAGWLAMCWTVSSALSV